MKQLAKIVSSFFSGYFSFIASAASIIGLIITFSSSKNAVIIALITFILFLSIILIRFLLLVSTFLLHKTEDGSHRFATYIRYSTEDGRFISYEVHKYLQCKTMLMDNHIHKYHWTGSSVPNITSDLQEISNTKKIDGDFDEVTLKFKKPLMYNDFCVVHIKMDIDDSSKKSQPFCETSVKEPVQLISFRIELRHLNISHNAKVTYRKTNAKFGEPFFIKSIPFDKSSHSYEHIIHNPDMGYTYTIDWAESPIN